MRSGIENKGADKGKQARDQLDDGDFSCLESSRSAALVGAMETARCRRDSGETFWVLDNVYAQVSETGVIPFMARFT